MMKCAVVILMMFHFIGCIPVKRSPTPPPTQVLDFMKQYGYLQKDKESSAALYTEEGLSEVLKTVQRFGAIAETGKLDNATLKLMVSPRCGNPDVMTGKRAKRFTFGSNGWNKRHVTYYVANWSSKLGESRVAALIEKALNTWAAYGNLKISRKSTPDADILVSFARGAHSDPFPFDGPGYVLAHAYFPNEGSDFSGDIHFDDDEDWIESTPGTPESGTDFYSVALHELGHSLGLGHSNDRNAVMFPYYRGDDESSLQLGQDDILGMYQLYIARPIKESTEYPTTEKTPPRRPGPSYTTTERTIGTQRDTQETTEHRRPTPPTAWYPTRSGTVTRKTTWYPSTTEDFSKRTTASREYPDTSVSFKEYPYTDRSITPESNNRYPSTDTKEQTGPRISVTINRNPIYSTPNFPRTTRPTPPPIPDICQGNVDAVANLRGEIFVFKNQYIWRFRDRNQLMPGYPIMLSQMFPSFPDDVKKIDAAYQRPDGNMVFFTGDKYWVYDGNVFIENSPKFIQDYGLPVEMDGVDAVQTWRRNGKTYLYKGNRFWKYNEDSKTIEPGYPAHIGKWRGVPDNLDDAMTWKDGKTYFFKRDSYWSLDNDHVIVSNDSPRSFTREWLGCR